MPWPKLIARKRYSWPTKLEMSRCNKITDEERLVGRLFLRSVLALRGLAFWFDVF